MTETINLLALDDAGFERLYETRIKPCFERYEGERAVAVKTFRERIWISGAGAIVLLFVVGFFARDFMPAFFVGAIGAFLTFLWADDALRPVRTKVKQDSCEAIASAIGVSYAMSGFGVTHVPRFRGLDLLPNYDRIKHEDQFTGAYHGANFTLCESHLERKHKDSKGRTSWVTVFRGQCIVVNFPREFLGVTIVRRDAGLFNFLGGGGALKKVSLEDPVFEKAFEVFSNDQVESRYLLHPMFMQRLVDLEAAFKGKRLRCGFEHGDLMIAVEGGDLFEPGSMFKPLADPARARNLVNDVASVMRVIDAVLTAQARRV